MVCRKSVIDLQMPASRNLAVNRNMNEFQRLMSGHGAAKTRHIYTLSGVAQHVYLRRACYARLLIHWLLLQRARASQVKSLVPMKFFKSLEQRLRYLLGKALH